MKGTYCLNIICIVCPPPTASKLLIQNVAQQKQKIRNTGFRYSGVEQGLPFICTRPNGRIWILICEVYEFVVQLVLMKRKRQWKYYQTFQFEHI